MATVLSNGRLDLGVGKGYRPPEFAGFCIPIEEATERFDEAMAFLRTAWTAADRFSHHGRRWHFENIVIEPRPVQQPHPPLWMGAGSFGSIQRAAREGFNLLLDQIAPVNLIIERVAAYRGELGNLGRSYRPGQIAVARALQIVRTEAERQSAYALRTKVLKAIGGLARGPGAERYQNIGSHADPNLASEESALLGTPEEIVVRLRARGRRCRLRAVGGPDRLQGGTAHVRRGDHARVPRQAGRRDPMRWQDRLRPLFLLCPQTRGCEPPHPTS